VINLIIGVILGTILTTVGYDMIASDDRNITIQTVTNIVIALATLIAVAINYLSIKNQKDIRRWEVNKEILINLSTTLSDLNSQTGKLAEIEFNHMQGIAEEHKFTPDNSIYKNFSRYLDHTAEVFGPVLNDNILGAIIAYKKSDEGIAHGVDVGKLGLFEAYEAAFGAQKKLQKTLSEQIKRYAKI
jgi:hypothetical protein